VLFSDIVLYREIVLYSNIVTSYKYIVLYSAGQRQAISGQTWRDTGKHFKLKNLIYGSMLLSGAVRRRSADPKFTDVVDLTSRSIIFQTLHECYSNIMLSARLVRWSKSLSCVICITSILSKWCGSQ
jgi:hypothetical protein